MPHYFSLGRQKIAGKTPWWTHLQRLGPLTRQAHFTQGSVEMLGCLKAQAGAGDRHRGTPWTTAWSLPRKGMNAIKGCHSSAAPSLTVEERGAEQHLCPYLAQLYWENTWVEGSALLNKPQIPCWLSAVEERRHFSAQQSKTRVQTSSLQAETGTEFIGYSAANYLPSSIN